MTSIRNLLFSVCLLSPIAAVSAAGTLPPAQQTEFDSQYQQGESLYSAKRFAEAIKCFQRALAIKPDPNVLYNIAQSHKKLEHHREAKDYFEWFLRIPNDISAAEKQNIEETIADLDQKIRKEEAAKVVLVQAEQPQRPKWRIALGITGIAAGAALVGFGGLAASIDGLPYLDSNGKEVFTRVYSTKSLAAGLIAPGALCILGGVVLLALPGERKRETDTKSTAQTLSFGAVGSGNGLVFRGVF